MWAFVYLQSFGLRQLLVVVLPSRPPTQMAYSIGQIGLCLLRSALNVSETVYYKIHHRKTTHAPENCSFTHFKRCAVSVSFIKT